MAKKTKKRPIRKAAKPKKNRTAKRSRSAKSSRTPKRKAAWAAKGPRRAKAKAPRRARTAKKPAGRVTARSVRQRAASAKPIRHLVEVDEERERTDTETTLLGSRGGRESDDLAEELGEAFVMTATSGEQADEDIRDQEVPEERGGPFVE